MNGTTDTSTATLWLPCGACKPNANGSMSLHNTSPRALKYEPNESRNLLKIGRQIHIQMHTQLETKIFIQQL